MKYESIGHANFVCEKIRENERLLSDLKAAEEIRIQLASGYHIKTIQCGAKSETDYRLDELAVKFKQDVINTISERLKSLHEELELI